MAKKKKKKKKKGKLPNLQFLKTDTVVDKFK